MLVRLALERRVLVLRLVSVHRVWVPPERVQHRGQALVARVLGAVALIVRVQKAQAQARIAAARLTAAAFAKLSYGC